jgi:hypothetical protein
MQEGWPPVLAITDPTDGGNPAAHEHDFGTSATAKTVALETNAPWKFTIDDATAYAKVIASSGGITAGVTQPVAPYTPDLPNLSRSVTFTPETGYTNSEYGTLFTASVTFATIAGGGATEATPKTVTFSREEPSRFAFLGYSLDAGVTVVPTASIASPVVLPSNASSTVRLYAETNRDWFGKLDAAQVNGNVSGYVANSYVNLATITARSWDVGTSYTANADKIVYYGHDDLADVNAFTVRQPPYTFAVSAPSPSTVAGVGGQVAVTVTTNAPSYTLNLITGTSTNVGSVSGNRTDSDVTNHANGTWSQTKTIDVNNNPGATARTVNIIHPYYAYTPARSFTQAQTYQYYIPSNTASLPTSQSELMTVAICPQGYSLLIDLPQTIYASEIDVNSSVGIWLWDLIFDYPPYELNLSKYKIENNNLVIGQGAFTQWAGVSDPIFISTINPWSWLCKKN